MSGVVLRGIPLEMLLATARDRILELQRENPGWEYGRALVGVQSAMEFLGMVHQPRIVAQRVLEAVE